MCLLLMTYDIYLKHLQRPVLESEHPTLPPEVQMKQGLEFIFAV